MKGNDIKSPIINSYDLMENLLLDLILEDLDIKTDIIIYENLNVSKTVININIYFQNKFNKN